MATTRTAPRVTAAPTIQVQATTTHTIKLQPTLKRKLLTELRAYAELDQQVKAIKHARDKHKDAVRTLRESTGEGSLTIEGFRITDVTGVSSTLDKKKLIAQGVTLAQIEAATVTKPKKAYEKITCPGAHADAGDDD